jgi:thiamine biosynthesis lipoprotein ApbE
VIADHTITADGLSTALFLKQPEMLATQFQFEYLILYDDYSFKKSDNFHAVLFTS